MGAVRYILRLIKQRELWDDYMQSHPQGNLLQSWGWGEIKQNAGWHPLRLALWDNQKQQIVAAAQVLRRTAPHVPLWAGHLAYIPKGPVLDWSQPQLVKDFFAHLHPYLRRQGALALRLEPAQAIDAPDQPALSAALAAMHFHSVTSIQPLRTIVLDLTP